MKSTFLKLAFFWIWLPAFGQTDPCIYGLARKSVTQEIYFAKINPSTGVVTNVSTSSLANSLTLGSTIDPFRKIFYFTSGGKFNGVDMITGSIITNPTITNINGTYFD